MRLILILIITSHSIIVFGQSNFSKKDSIQVDSFTMQLEKLIKDWDPKNEPWNFVDFEIKEIGLTVRYGQQSIHPFLAEYNRKIQFSTDTSMTDTIPMTLNSGGRTLIRIYYVKLNSMVVMEDRFGEYYFDIDKMEYSENVWGEYDKYKDEKEFLGQINGQEYPLRYEPKK